MAWARVGIGGLTTSRATTAKTLATAARPIAATVGSKPRTAIFVSGRLKLNTRTPSAASRRPMRFDRIDGVLLGQLQFEPRIAAELPIGEVGDVEPVSFVERDDVRPRRRCLEHD